jgi:hypothetical protein
MAQVPLQHLGPNLQNLIPHHRFGLSQVLGKLDPLVRQIPEHLLCNCATIRVGPPWLNGIPFAKKPLNPTGGPLSLPLNLKRTRRRLCPPRCPPSTPRGRSGRLRLWNHVLARPLRRVSLRSANRQPLLRPPHQPQWTNGGGTPNRWMRSRIAALVGRTGPLGSDWLGSQASSRSAGGFPRRPVRILGNAHELATSRRPTGPSCETHRAGLRSPPLRRCRKQPG